jgi:hypothetical protein
MNLTGIARVGVAYVACLLFLSVISLGQTGTSVTLR